MTFYRSGGTSFRSFSVKKWLNSPSMSWKPFTGLLQVGDFLQATSFLYTKVLLQRFYGKISYPGLERTVYLSKLLLFLSQIFYRQNSFRRSSIDRRFHTGLLLIEKLLDVMWRQKTFPLSSIYRTSFTGPLKGLWINSLWQVCTGHLKRKILHRYSIDLRRLQVFYRHKIFCRPSTDQTSLTSFL